MTADFGNSKSPKERSDPLETMPPFLRKWAEKKGLARLVERYGWSICRVCGRIGIRWSTDWIPVGINLDFQSKRSGWIHPPADGWDGASGNFRQMWRVGETVAKEDGQNIDTVIAGHEPQYFDLYMKGVVNTIDNDFLFGTFRNKQGVQNPWDFCVSGFSPLGTRQGGKHKICPVCGEPGTGEGVVRNERRFFHESNRSCYMGMVNPVRKQAAEVKCPKCGEDGRESVSKGYKYIRHKNKTCYVGKLSDELP